MNSSASSRHLEKNRFSELAPEHQDFILVAHENAFFGLLPKAEVRNGKLMQVDPDDFFEDLRLPESKNAKPDALPTPDSLVKRNWIDLFNRIKKLDRAEIRNMEFRNGMPISLRIRRKPMPNRKSPAPTEHKITF